MAERLRSLRLVSYVLIASFAVSLGWAYAAIFRAPASGMYHDDGIYLVTARALAEGEGYRISSLPDNPIQTKYPILFPFLLSVVWRIVPSFPENLLWLRLVPLLAAGAWLYLSWRLLLRCGASTAAALTIVALTAASPAVAFFAGTLLSETLFAALLTGTLLSLTAARDGRAGRWRACALAGLLAGACLVTRTAGIAVVIAGLGWLLTRRRWTDAAAFASAAAVTAGPWIWWVAGHFDAGTDQYYSASVYGAQGGWNVVFSHSWREKAVVVGQNIVYAALTPATLWGQRPWLVIPSLVACPLIVRGLWLSRAHPVTWCLLAYLGMVLLWVWPPTRLLVPVVPLILWQVSLPVRGIWRAVAAGAAAVLMVTGSLALFQLARDAPARGTAWPVQAGPPDGWRRLEALYVWVRRATPDKAVLIGDLDPTYYLYTGRKAVRTFAPDGYSSYYDTALQPDVRESVEVFRRRVLKAGADFWIWSEGPRSSAAYAALRDGVSRTYPGSLSIATGDSGSGYAVYRIDRTRLEPAGSPPPDAQPGDHP